MVTSAPALYALKEAFHGGHILTPDNILWGARCCSGR